MIQGMILDIDGVLVGQKIGFNSPTPNRDVLDALKQILSRGLFISLCTAKPYFAILDIIKGANLDNLHITDGGAVITDPINSVILKKFVIESGVAQEVTANYIEKGVYTEIYTDQNYYIQRNQISDITKKHSHILQREPIAVDSLIAEAKVKEIVKIMPIAEDESDKKRLLDTFRPFEHQLTLNWGIHPVALSLQFGVITSLGISKKQGLIEIAKHYNKQLTDILGVGDSKSDWEFIELCGFAGTMENAKQELKDLVKTKGEGKYYIGGNVDNNGVLDIFRFFNLIK